MTLNGVAAAFRTPSVSCVNIIETPVYSLFSYYTILIPGCKEKNPVDTKNFKWYNKYII